ncbi:MAG: cell division protein FtsL [Ignavibacterium sp.]|uniref:cell division protein FtsL n=1 Tax=Ignavibacterium sp. TaxID=2651167 RepID=UPI00404B5845
MSKSSKPLIFYILFLLVVVTVFFIAVVITKISYDETVKIKDEALRKLKIENQKMVSLQAEYQDVTTEEKIRSVATSQLGMIKRIEPAVVLSVSKEKIEELQKELINKYE